MKTPAKVVQHVVRFIAQAIRSPAPRSSQWPALRRKFLEAHPSCAACGGTSLVEPHHIVPVHKDKTRELDETNLLPLCMGYDRHCHLLIGHSGSFVRTNERVVEDAAAALQARQGGSLVLIQGILEKAREHGTL